MNTLVRTAIVVPAALLLVVTGLTGCQSWDRREEMKSTPESRGPEVVIPGPEHPPGPPPASTGETGRATTGDKVVKPPTEPMPKRYSDAEKQDIVHNALLELHRLIISSDERLKLSGRSETTAVAADLLTTKLAELGFRVTQSASRLPFDPSEGTMDGFRKANNCNLAIVIEGTTRPADKFGEFWSYHGELAGKVLNLTTHQIIASKTIRKAGRRALNEDEAARDALELAAADLATYLTDEIARKWEATSLVRMRMSCTDLHHYQEAEDLRSGLQQRSGIYYVSLEQWDKRSDRGVYEILCRFDVQQHLGMYVDQLRKGKIQVERIEQAGKVIKADQDVRD